MTKPKIGIIIGTTREGRFGDKPAQWIFDMAARRDDLEAELVDLRDFPMPFFDEAGSNAWVPSKSEVARRWQKKVAEFDGYVFVTAEYNRAPSGVLKNALDYAYPEWNRKAAACVGYGGVGAARAVEQLRLIFVELQMAPTRTGVHIQGADFMAARKGQNLADIAHLQPSAKAMLDELVWWSSALAAGREDVRPALAESSSRDASPVTEFVAELQAAIDAADADRFNARFSADVLWGSPFGAVVDGYDAIHAIHTKMFAGIKPVPGASRYVVEHARFPTPDVAVAYVRRLATTRESGEPEPGVPGSFDELALFVLVRRDGTWWLAAGQHVPDRRDVYARPRS
ncbi:SgcJ/EcaC family oxidoreductase [Polyangium aurulentum]|nr:SgcJ/EcaC family oxidoreductase [Polyangium aurulentum]UQA59850.1 SgcJ/EcaC family oxidoreductase [Polyangium aurulentum]